MLAKIGLTLAFLLVFATYGFGIWLGTHAFHKKYGPLHYHRRR